jgi:flagellar export protein FliJ
MPSALDILARLRRTEVEAARRDLAAALDAEQAASVRLRDARAAPAAEAATLRGAPDRLLMQAYAAWLPACLREIDSAGRGLREAEAGTQSAKTELAAHMAALKAAETLLDERAAAARKKRLSVLQHRLDDLPRQR